MIDLSFETFLLLNDLRQEMFPNSVSFNGYCLQVPKWSQSWKTWNEHKCHIQRIYFKSALGFFFFSQTAIVQQLKNFTKNMC